MEALMLKTKIEITRFLLKKLVPVMIRSKNGKNTVVKLTAEETSENRSVLVSTKGSKAIRIK
jgi:hypothetical protein